MASKEAPLPRATSSKFGMMGAEPFNAATSHRSRAIDRTANIARRLDRDSPVIAKGHLFMN